MAVPEVEAPDLDRLVRRGRGDELVVVRDVHPHDGQLVAIQAGWGLYRLWSSEARGWGYMYVYVSLYIQIDRNKLASCVSCTVDTTNMRDARV